MNLAAAAAGLPLSVGDLHVRLIDFGSAVDKHSIEHLYSTEGPSDDEQTAEYAPPEALLARYASFNLHCVLHTLFLCACVRVCVCARSHSPAVLGFATNPEAPIAHPEVEAAMSACHACVGTQCTHLMGSLETRRCMH